MRPSAVLKLDCDCTDRLDGGRRSVCGGEDIGLADMVGFWPSLCLLWPVLAVLLEVVREAGRRAKGFFCAWFRSRSWADQRRASGQQHLSCLPVGEAIGSQKLLCLPEVLCYRGTVDASRWIRLKFGSLQVWQKHQSKMRRTDDERTSSRKPAGWAEVTAMATTMITTVNAVYLLRS